MREYGIIIALDGPAGVGKSSVSSAIAKETGYRFLNTGEMFRALAWKALDTKTSLDDEKALVGLANKCRWEFHPVDGFILKTFIDGHLMDDRIFDEEVSKASSKIARYGGVRTFLKNMQRALGEKGGIIMEGRDIGSEIFPDAELKIYLDASPQFRAQRRVKQLTEKGLPANYDEILEGIIARDNNDKGRSLAPLKQAQGSVYIDTSTMTIDEVIKSIMTLVGDKC